MKKLVLILAALLVFPSAGAATTRYVSGILKITLRTGPGNDHRILTMVETGQAVEVVNSDDPQWTLVRLSNGKEGWVLDRFLTDRKPNPIEIEKATEQIELLTQRVDELLKEKTDLKSNYDRVESKLSEAQNTLKALSKSYETLKKKSSDQISLQAKYKQLTSDLAEQTKNADKMAEELSRARFYYKIKWFLSGAGVLLVGFLLGLSARKNRRRSSLL